MKTLFIPTPTKLDRIKDADFEYNFVLPRLGVYSTELKTTLARRNIGFDLRTYSRFALGRVRLRLKQVPLSWCWLLSQYYTLPTSDIGLLSSDIILAYERYPKNAKLPVIWITGPTDIEKLRSRGWSEHYIHQEIEFKREVNAQAMATVLTTRSKREMFDKVIQPSRPTHVIPFFQPIEPISYKQFTSKWSNVYPARMLFVGRMAKRKGLSLVLDAFAALQEHYPGKVSLHIVSSLSDGPIVIPKLPGLTYDAEASHQRVMDLMREAHYLVMPSREESYGWVYIEAMSQGTIPVAPNAAAQQELLDEGKAGRLVELTASAVGEAVALGIEQPESARDLALRAFDLWKTRYAPEVVAAEFAALAHA